MKVKSQPPRTRHKMFINRKEKRLLSALLKLKTTKIKNHFRGANHQKLVSTVTCDVAKSEQSEQDDEPLLEIDFDCADNFYQ